LDSRPRGYYAGTVKGLDKETLLDLLGIYETALRELQRMRDPSVTGLILRLERRRAEVIGALATAYFDDD
jgi:hypothetical protein